MTAQQPHHDTTHTRRRDPEDRQVPSGDTAAMREKNLDKTIADSFPDSDPPSSIPNLGRLVDGAVHQDGLWANYQKPWAGIAYSTKRIKTPPASWTGHKEPLPGGWRAGGSCWRSDLPGMA